MSAYHYQCANCYCTLHIDPEPVNGVYESVVNGDLCYQCESEQNTRNYSYYDDDD